MYFLVPCLSFILLKRNYYTDEIFHYSFVEQCGGQTKRKILCLLTESYFPQSQCQLRCFNGLFKRICDFLFNICSDAQTLLYQLQLSLVCGIQSKCSNYKTRLQQNAILLHFIFSQLLQGCKISSKVHAENCHFHESNLIFLPIVVYLTHSQNSMAFIFDVTTNISLTCLEAL